MTQEYTVDFQIEILGFLLNDSIYFGKFERILNKEFFTEFQFKSIYELSKKFFIKYKNCPTQPELLNIIKEDTNNKNVKYSDYVDYVQRIFNSNFNSDYIKDQLKDFIKVQAMRMAVKEAIKDFKNGPRIVKLIENAVQLVKGIDFSPGYFYKKAVNDRIEFRESGIRVQNQVPTLFTRVDDSLSGGPGAGELNCAVAPPGTGKSIFLVNIAVNAALLGYNVLYFSLEMGASLIGNRIDSRLCNYDKYELKFKPDKLSGAVIALPGDIIIKEYPSGTVTAKDLSRHIKEVYNSLGWLPHLVLIDYGDLLKCSCSYTNERIRLRSIYEEMRGSILQEWGIPGWTVHQANVFHEKNQKEVETIMLRHIAEAKIAISATSDYAISLNQTSYERNLPTPEMRFYVMKHRNGLDKQTFPMLIDKKRFSITDSPIEVINKQK